MYMIRNPWGDTYYNGSWKSSDSSWTSDYISQVPHDIDPTTAYEHGIFFVEDVDFLRCFDNFQMGHYRDDEGYTDDWFDKEDDRGLTTAF